MLCSTCAYDNDRSHCDTPELRDVVECIGYVYKYKDDETFTIPYNFPLNTRKGFKTIYYLMRLSQHDMTTVITDIIKVRHKAIDVILNACDKVEKENSEIVKVLYGGA